MAEYYISIVAIYSDMFLLYHQVAVMYKGHLNDTRKVF